MQVRRETREEAGVHVGTVHILGSQPWPVGARPCPAARTIQSSGQVQAYIHACHRKPMFPVRQLSLGKSNLCASMLMRCETPAQAAAAPASS